MESTSAQRRRIRRLPLSHGVVVLMAMVVGIVIGLLVGEPARALEPIGQIFVRLLVCAAVPLVVANLLTGITGLDDTRLLGRVGGRFTIFFVLSTFLAIGAGLVFTALYDPGARVAGLAVGGATAVPAGKAPGLGDFLFNLVPENVIAALGEGQVPQVIIFTLILGIAVLLCPEETRARFHRGVSVLDEVLRRLVEVIMMAAPVGIGALAASAAAEFGAQMLAPLAIFLAAIWSAQLVVAVAMLLALMVFGRTSPLAFLRQTAELYVTAAATCSSLASLAVALRLSEERLRLPRPVYSLTLPLGSQLSKEGTAAMLAAALMFTAQASGVEFQLQDYATIMIVGLFLAGASGGIPGGGLVKVLLFVQAFHLPLEMAAVIGGVYRLIDIGNTTVNVLGDMVGTRIVAASGGWTADREKTQAGNDFQGRF